MRRIFFFLLTNLAVMATISIVLSVLGVGPYISASTGLNYQTLMIFCLVWGMGGAFISLAISKRMAKWMMRLQTIDPNTNNPSERWLYDTVQRLAQDANLPKTPEVAIYQSPEVNAFATGPTKRNSLVAVSTGLLSQMNRQEVEGVLGHEVAHIANGDMVTMTLIQGVVNAFVMFFARIAAFTIAQAMRSDDEEGPSMMVHYLLTFVFDILFGILGSMVVAWFSRLREFRADQGGAQLAGTGSMVSALQRLRSYTGQVDPGNEAMASLKISGGKKGFMALLSTHPPLEERIRKLQQQG